jgi:hypothetical protein
MANYLLTVIDVLLQVELIEIEINRISLISSGGEDTGTDVIMISKIYSTENCGKMAIFKFNLYPFRQTKLP